LLERFLDGTAHIDLAYNGETAIVKVCQHNYDVILLDICLGKGIDGFGVLREIKEKGNNMNTPVIAVTGSATEFDKEKFLSCGFSEFIAKPFTKQDLLDAIERVTSDDV